jgi:AraC-like DNA-binding protein
MNPANSSERDALADFGIVPDSSPVFGRNWADCKAQSSHPTGLVVPARACEWSGFSLEISRGRPWQPDQLPSAQYHVLLQIVASEASVRRTTLPPLPSELKRGELVILDAAGVLPPRLTFVGDFALVSLSAPFMRWAATNLVRDFGKLALRHLETTSDPVLRGLVLALWAEAESGYLGGAAYGESVAGALAAHLIRRFLATESGVAASGGGEEPESGLGRRELKLCLDYIETHLSRKLSLKEIASQIGLGENHFGARFRISTGQTPHQYVLHRRVDRARERLLNSQASVAEIAAALGFCDQGNLTLHFRRLLGVTPLAYRKGQSGPR